MNGVNLDAEDAGAVQTRQNIEIGKQKKEVGDQAFKKGDIQAGKQRFSAICWFLLRKFCKEALTSYHQVRS